MSSPNESVWNRVEELAAAFEPLEKEDAARLMKDLQARGEPPTVLSLLGTWLTLPPLASPLGAGDLLAGRYRLQARLGEGGMGTVWRATQSLIARDVAVKIIHPALVTPALQARFSDEIEILGRLDHPGIVRIFDAGIHEHDGAPVPFFAMELVDGTPLSRWAAAHRADRGKLLRLMSELCGAVQHAHDRKIVHRDLKPANVLVGKSGHPMVLDFGVARLAGVAAEEQGGAFSGTPNYAAPEQHLGRDHDFSSGESVDVYAMGAILFELLSGRRLYEFPPGTPIFSMHQRIVEGPTPRLADVLPDCPPVIDEIVDRALQRNPADRYFSIGVLARALNRAAGHLYGPPKPPPPLWAPEAGQLVPETSWRLLEKLGVGSAGQVWLAEHDGLQTRCVFKFCDSEDKTRTLRRELTLFRLLKERVGQNPHFIPLHEVSLEEPPWYLRMDHVEARSLSLWWREQPADLSVEWKVEIVAQVAEALQAAHEAGILHRDIKPENILVKMLSDPNGARRPPEQSLHIFVADFGIGQIVTDELMRSGVTRGSTFLLSEVTRTTTAITGTMLYLAPEVMEGGPATARSDIYSLGVVLWQLLTGNLHGALDPAEWPQRISDPLLREDLQRCLAGIPAKRWPSAGQLAASLRAIPLRRAKEAREREELARLERAAYRRGVLLTLIVAALLLAGVGTLAWYAIAKAEQAEHGEQVAILGELQGLEKLQSPEALRRLKEVMPGMKFKDPALKREFRTIAISILANPPFEPLDPPVQNLRETDSLADLGERAIVMVNGLPRVFNLAVPQPPDGQDLAGAEPGMHHLQVNTRGRFAGGIAADGSLRLWGDLDLFDPQRLLRKTIPGPVHASCFAIAPTTFFGSFSNAVALARPDGAVDVVLMGSDVFKQTRLQRKSDSGTDMFPESTPATMLAFCNDPEGVLACAGPASNLVLFWNIKDDKKEGLKGEFAGSLWHSDVIRCLGWNPRGQELATGTEDGWLRIWRFLQSGPVPRDAPLRSVNLGESIRDLAWSADGELIAVLLDSGNIRLLRAQAPDSPLSYKFNHPGAKKIAFIGSSAFLTWGAGECRMWGKRASCFVQKIISAHETTVAYHPRGMLTAGSGTGISFLLPGTLAWTGGFRNDSSAISWLGDDLVHQKDGHWARTPIRLAQNPERFHILPGKDLKMDRWAASPSGRRAVFLSDGELWSVEERLDAEPTASLALDIQPHMLTASDLEPVAAWLEKDQLKLHNFATGGDFPHPIPGILSMCFSPSTGVLACRTETGVMFVDPRLSKPEFSPVAAPAAGASPIVFSPDGEWLVVCGPNNELLIGTMPAASSPPVAAGLRRVFAEPVLLREPSPRQITSLAWDASGSHLSCGTSSGVVQSWNLSLLRRTLRLWNLDWSTKPIPVEPSLVPITLR